MGCRYQEWRCQKAEKRRRYTPICIHVRGYIMYHNPYHIYTKSSNNRFRKRINIKTSYYRHFVDKYCLSTKQQHKSILRYIRVFVSKCIQKRGFPIFLSCINIFMHKSTLFPGPKWTRGRLSSPQSR